MELHTIRLGVSRQFLYQSWLFRMEPSLIQNNIQLTAQPYAHITTNDLMTAPLLTGEKMRNVTAIGPIIIDKTCGR